MMSIEAKNDWQASETEEANNCELVSWFESYA